MAGAMKEVQWVRSNRFSTHNLRNTQFSTKKYHVPKAREHIFFLQVFQTSHIIFLIQEFSGKVNYVTCKKK